ncbi:hypothetical protein [Limnohabitans sp.]|uniref:hypothetical protein n=1 Tax=Limnohabitans sp. TaxID=1907725 RepID=UPI002898081D|nr:hypothetical protein [Limnohabitans sp.]
MGISEGYKRIAEKQKAEWLVFVERVQRAGLPAPERTDFSNTRPITRRGWHLLEELLLVENSLHQEERAEIQRGLDLLRIYERRDEIRSRLMQGADLPDPQWPEVAPPIPSELALSPQCTHVLLWAAIKELGFDKTDNYKGYYQNAQVQLYRIAKERGDF